VRSLQRHESRSRSAPFLELETEGSLPGTAGASLPAT
jgi:hypothetical protein